jgi:hypothetical protein
MWQHQGWDAQTKGERIGAQHIKSQKPNCANKNPTGYSAAITGPLRNFITSRNAPDEI